MGIWQEVVKKVADEVPPFNDFLLLDFREQSINEMVAYNDCIEQQIAAIFGPEVEYIGYEEMTPEEYISNIVKSKGESTFRGVDINRQNLRILKFKFKYHDEELVMYTGIPFMKNNVIDLFGKQYYPILTIGERGGIHRSTSSVIIKVMRAPLTFWRSTRYGFVTISGKIFKEPLITTKIHFGTTGSNKQKPPLLVYLLSKYGLARTLEMTGVAGKIDFVTTPTEDPQYDYIKLSNGSGYIRVFSIDLSDQHIREDNRVIRVLTSLMAITDYYPRFQICDLVSPNPAYYIAVLGKYINPLLTVESALIANAKTHIRMNDTLIDPIAIQQLKQENIVVNDFYEFMAVVFNHIDDWLTHYNPIDLCQKKIGAMDQMMGGVARKQFLKAYKKINNRNVGITLKTLRSFMKSASYQSNWMNKNRVFRCNPSRYNDNSLLAVLAKRLRTLQNTETGNAGNESSKTSLPITLLKAHKSQLLVESILDITNSSPVVAGSINPYLEITESGQPIIPDWYNDELKNVYVV